jgi:hypothetical protein
LRPCPWPALRGSVREGRRGVCRRFPCTFRPGAAGRQVPARGALKARDLRARAASTRRYAKRKVGDVSSGSDHPGTLAHGLGSERFGRRWAQSRRRAARSRSRPRSLFSRGLAARIPSGLARCCGTHRSECELEVAGLSARGGSSAQRRRRATCAPRAPTPAGLLSWLISFGGRLPVTLSAVPTGLSPPAALGIRALKSRQR